MGTVQGGTALEESPRRWPLLAAIGGGIVGVALIAYVFAGGGDNKPKPATQPQPEEQQPVAETPPLAVDTSQPAFAAPRPTTNVPSRPDPNEVAASLERDLKRQRLWANVTVNGSTVEVRSGSCGEPAMSPILDGVAPAFKAAGLTKLRCVEQSGRVVADRDL